MLGLIMSLDYEIYGSGAGSFDDLMIDPTERMLDIFDANEAKLTIMAEVAEIMALEGHKSSTFDRITSQLSSAIERGHDVQLHLHPAWFNAAYENGKWTLDFTEYALVNLGPEKISEYLNRGKTFLEQLGQAVDPTYKCIAFRAGNWLIQPSHDVVPALEQLGFAYDTSVFEGGYSQVGDYLIDYRNVPSNLFEWNIDPNEITSESCRSGLTEIPIYAERVFITSMLTPRRAMLQWKLRRGAKQVDEPDESAEPLSLGKGEKTFQLNLFRPKKFDFCRLGFSEMSHFVTRAGVQAGKLQSLTPLVAIGHSTEFIDDGELNRFLGDLNTNRRSEVVSTTFRDLYHLRQVASPEQLPLEETNTEEEG